MGVGRANSLPTSINSPQRALAEWVESEVFDKIDYLQPSDALATYCEHIAVQISKVLAGKRVLVTGGGAWNDYLLGRIEFGVELERPEKEVVDFKEAIILHSLLICVLPGRTTY